MRIDFPEGGIEQAGHFFGRSFHGLVERGGLVGDGDGITAGRSRFQPAFGLDPGACGFEVFHMDFGAGQTFGESAESRFDEGGEIGDRGFRERGVGVDFDFHDACSPEFAGRDDVTDRVDFVGRFEGGKKFPELPRSSP